MCLQGKLPLNMITVTTPCQDVKPNTFMIEGVLRISQIHYYYRMLFLVKIWYVCYNIDRKLNLIVYMIVSCFCTHAFLWLYWCFVAREADQSHRRILSWQERVPRLDSVLQKRWRTHPEPSSPRLWHHLHADTETGEQNHTESVMV